MPYETLRFIHAARALVDHALSETGPLAASVKTVVRTASVRAFRQLVTECLEQDVDFLLLTGDTFDQADHSIKALVELRRGFEELDEAGIQVFVVPGRSDPAAAWESFPQLPGNVTIFRSETDDPVAVLRDGAVIASIRSIGWRQSWFAWDDEEPVADRTASRSREADDEETHRESVRRESLVHESDDPELEENPTDLARLSSEDDTPGTKGDGHREIRRIHSPADLRPNHFAIAVVRSGVDRPGDNPQADYLAVVGGRERTTTKGTDWLMHFPGGTQGLLPDETGLHGASLVDLDEDGIIRCRFLPTSTVRWEGFELNLDSDSTLEDVAIQMADTAHRLCGIERKVSESDDAADHDSSDHAEPLLAEACLLRWTIQGHGPLFDSLFESSTQSALIEELELLWTWPADVPCAHQFRLVASEPAIERASNDDDQLDVPTEYFWRVDQAQPLGTSAWNDLGSEQLTQLNAAAPRCDASVVFSLARRRGWNWFSRKTDVSRTGRTHDASVTEAREGATR